MFVLTKAKTCPQTSTSCETVTGSAILETHTRRDALSYRTPFAITCYLCKYFLGREPSTECVYHIRGHFSELRWYCNWNKIAHWLPLHVFKFDRNQDPSLWRESKAATILQPKGLAGTRLLQVGAFQLLSGCTANCPACRAHKWTLKMEFNKTMQDDLQFPRSLMCSCSQSLIGQAIVFSHKFHLSSWRPIPYHKTAKKEMIQITPIYALKTSISQWNLEVALGFSRMVNDMSSICKAT